MKMEESRNCIIILSLVLIIDSYNGSCADNDGTVILGNVVVSFLFLTNMNSFFIIT